MSRRREVGIERADLATVVSNRRTTAVIGIDARIGIECPARSSGRIITGLALVDILRPGISTVQAQLRADGIDLREVHHELQTHAVDRRTVVLHGVLHERTLILAGSLHPLLRRIVGITDPDAARLAVDAERRIGRHLVGPAVGPLRGKRRNPIGKRIVLGTQLIGEFGAVEITGQRHGQLAPTHVDAHLGIAVALPSQILVVEHAVRLNMIDVDALSGTVSGTENPCVAVTRQRIENVERRQLLGHAPTAAQGELLADAVFEVQARRKAGRLLVRRILDPGLLGPQTGHELQRRTAQRHREHLLDIPCEVVHVRDIGIRTRTVTIRRQCRIVVICTLPHVAVGTPCGADLGTAVHPAPMTHPGGFQPGGIVELLGIDIAQRIVGSRKHIRDEISCVLAMHRRVGDGHGLVFASTHKIVGIGDRRVEIDVGNPFAVELPFERRIGPQGVVARLLPLSDHRIGVFVGIHAADVGRRTDIETQHLGERILVVERNSRTRIGSIGRHGILRRPRILEVGVQHAVRIAQIESFGGRNLLGARISREHDRIGCLALAGRNLDHARRQIAVLGRGDARHDLDRLDVRRSDVARADARHGIERRIGRQTHTVDLDRRTERRIACVRPAAAQREWSIYGQIGIHGLAARQQRRDVRSVDHLEVVDGIRPDGARGGHRIGRLPGCHHHAFEREVVLGKIQYERIVIPSDRHLDNGRRIAQARHGEASRTRRHAFHTEAPLAVGHSPQPVVGQFDHGLPHGAIGSGRQHLSGDGVTLRRNIHRDDDSAKQQEKFFHSTP